MNRLIQAGRLLGKRGPDFLIYFLSGYLYPKWALAILSRYSTHRLKRIVVALAAALAALAFIGLGFWWSWANTVILALVLLSLAFLAWKLAGFLSLQRLLRRARELQKHTSGSPFTRWADWPVSPVVRAAVQRELDAKPGSEILLGEIDNDGRLWSALGDLPGWQFVSQDTFVRRYRFPLALVLMDGYVLVKKQFGRDRHRFAREWYNLAALSPRANVPAVYRADEKNRILYKNMVVGRTIRDLLVEAGAKILNIQTDSDPELAHLSGEKRLHAILERGHWHLQKLFPEAFFKKLEAQMDAVHRCGITKLSLTFGNVMVDSHGKPWLIDMEGSKSGLRTDSPLFLWLRDQDRLKYERIYGRELMTEARARRQLAHHKAKLGGWYAPVDFGGGLAVGGFWTVESGTGRWEYLNRDVVAPLVEGKRVLDLGTNNGLMPLLMLRAGAREVVGLELSPDFVERARLLHRIIEWRDMRAYAFKLIPANMLDILEGDYTGFDAITAFCTLYYLSESEMAQVVRRCAELSSLIVVQANEGTRADTVDNKSYKSSLAFLLSIIQENGFPCTVVSTKPDYSRPIIVGKKS